MCSMFDITSYAARALKTVLIVVGLALPIETLLAHTINCNSNPDTIAGIIYYDTSGPNDTYCELCGIGQVKIVVRNPTHEDMANFVITHEFDSDELEYVPGSTQGGTDPTITNGGRTLTWTSAQIGGLLQIDGSNNHNYNTVDVIFQVRSRAPLEENLVNIDRDILATADFDFCPLDTNKPGSVSFGKIQLPIIEPIPRIFKRGRNVDAAQTNWTSSVYGNINDDVIWRIQIQNSGSVSMQDVKFDDLMQNGNFQINYACPTLGEANSIAAADGVGPVGNCIVSSNTITPFVVDGDFGSQASVAEDVPLNSSIYVYLVGKVLNSCTPNRTNTANNVEWGCEVRSPPEGGITQTSTGASAGSSTTTLSALVNANNLTVVPVLTGLNTSEPVGARGLMTITVTNNSGGTVRDIVFNNELPPEYVVDSTFTPTLTMQGTSGTMGDYDGRVDYLDIKMDDGTGTIVAAPPVDPLDYKIPVISLLSTDTHPDHLDQKNMLRHGDRAVIRFRVVMIKADHFDNNANMDVTPEVYTDTTDPANYHNNTAPNSDQLSNILNVSYLNFCDLVTTQTKPVINSSFDSFPEDLDIDIPGAAASAFILTNDPTQPLALSVVLTNNGGHTADNYYAFVSFGTTMKVTAVPTGCSLTTNPPLLEVWEDPADIPKGATVATDAAVYVCDSRSSPTGLGPITPGSSRTLNFEVVKVSLTDPNGAARLTADDLTFRADVVGEVALSDNTLTGSGALLTFPTVPVLPIVNRANNYSLDSVRAKVIGFNLTKTQVGNCSENNPPPASPDVLVQIGEECKVHIETGGWFGFATPGYTYIAVQKVQVDDQLPNGQGYISTSVPAPASDLTIKSITLAETATLPAIVAPTALDEGSFSWLFNQNVVTERITVKDQWFRMDATTRILNDPIDSRAIPNVHGAQSRNVLNSTFEAVFNNSSTGFDEIFTLGPGVVGYPSEAVRRVDLTVTEPNISILKEVCNETLNGVGAGCSTFSTSITNGDTQDSYIYKITLTNLTAVPAYAPAYNLTATDTLDSSDLMLVDDFGSDLLDNDGDGLVDGADPNEGSISENNVYVAPGPPVPTPAILTFSHTHSTALLKILPGVGNAVTLYYRVNPDDAIAPLQTLTNSVSATYDSMENVSGNQSVPLGTNSTAGGARVYTTATATASVQILPLTTVPKEITRLANSTITGGQPQPVAVGEEIEYQLRSFIPVANLSDFYIRDELPAGISCSEAPDVNLDPGGPHDAAGFFPGGVITPTCNDNLVYWYFGDQELTKASSNSLYEFAVNFIARVDNTAGVNDTNVISNGDPVTNTFLSYDNDAGTQVRLDFSQFDIRVHEPKITLTKTYETVSNDAGDVITVTVTATNTDTVATAYNLKVFDDLAAVSNLTFLNNVAGTDPPDNVDVVTLGANRPIFSWNVDAPGYAKYSIPPGATKSFTFDIQVDTGAQPHEILNNTIRASWQSLPTNGTALNTITGSIGADGDPDGMRYGGVFPNAGDVINDYQTTASAISTVPALTITKSDLDNTQDVEVGVHKNYQIVVNLPEGTTNNLIVNDNLNFSGLSYVLENNATYDVSYTFSGIATINGVAAAESAFTAFPADGATGTAIWNIGTVVTTTEDDTTGAPVINPSITINYYARVNNDVSTNTGSTLQNEVTTNYQNGETPATTEALIATTPVLTVTESVLTVAKAATLITAAPITGGDIIEYVVTIPNTGNATAYDINIVDTLPTDMGLDTTFTPTATIGGVAVGGFTATPTNSPNGPLIWGRGNSDNNLDLPASSTLILTYRTILQSTAQLNTDHINSVLVDWTSLNDTVANSATYERTGAGCPTITAPNDYCTGPATTTISTTDTNNLAKAVILDTYAPTNDAIVRVGDTVTYELSLNLQEGTTRSVNVRDVLPAGLEFIDIVSINGDLVADYTAPGAGSGSNFSYPVITAASLPVANATGTLNFPIGDVINDPLGDATTDTLLIVYRARVIENTLAHVPTTTLTNTATLQYIDALNAPVVDAVRLERTASITVYQPVLTTPTKTERTGLISPASVLVSDTMQFRLESCNTTGLSPAYNVQITDNLDSELNQTTIANLVVTINGVAATAGVDYTYTAPVARGGFMQFDLTTAVNPAQCVRIDYDIGIYNDFAVNTTWDNTVTLNEYWSLPAKAGQQYAALGPTAFSMTNNDPFVPPAKVMLSPVSDEATIGETVVYQISLPASNGARHDIVVSDDLHSSLEFVSATEVSGNGFTLVDTTTLPGTVRLGITYIPALQNAVIQITARVANNVNANAGVSFANTTTYDYAYTSGGATVNGGVISTADSLKIVEPLLALAKSVLNTTSPGNPPNAGDVLRYSLTFTASGGVASDNFEDAFDVSVVDSLSLGLAYQTTTSTVDGAGNTITDPTVTGDGVSIAQSLTWNLADATADIDVVEGTVVTVTYDVVVLNTVLASQTLTNSAVIQWTGLDGINALERTGTATPVVNDYFTGPATTSLTTPNNTAITKTKVTDTYGAADVNLRIGDIVEYQISVTLQEGLTNGVVVTDTLSPGLAFEAVTDINGDTSSPFSSVAPFVHNDISAVTGVNTVTFTLGNITNTADNNPANDNFIIRYRARVLDNVHAQVNTKTLTNTAVLDYTTAAGAASTSSAVNLTLLQPILTVTKTAVAAGGVTVPDPTNTILEPDELVTYTVEITNSGLAPAYDLVLDDVIPVGMRNGTATITMVSTTILPATALTNIAPVYNSTTGLASWNFDSGTADEYNIAAGQTLRVVYQVQADSDIGAALTLTNQAVARLYYSFDDDAVPILSGTTGVREIYGPSNTASTTLTTAGPGVLLKENPVVTDVTIGETFTYKITVPAVPIDTYLHDVRISDDLSASAADLIFVSVSKISGSQPWTPANTGTAPNLVIEDATNGIDIPPGEQVEIGVTVTVANNAPPNTSPLTFINTATYTYNQIANDVSSQQNGFAGSTTNMTIVEPDLTLLKTGPASINVGTAETFTLKVHNRGTSSAYDATIVDVLPTLNPAAGGMCDTAPVNVTARMYDALGTTPIAATLVQGTDYVYSYAGCTLTLTMQSTAAAVASDTHLVITYDAALDADAPYGTAYTNIAGATQWFSLDTAGAGATGQIRTYTKAITNGTVGTLDHEDALTVASATPTVTVEKRVLNIRTGLYDGNAIPGDKLRYEITITNTSGVVINDFSFVDELDALNAAARFKAGTLTLTTIPLGAPAGSTVNLDASGGAKGTGLLNISNLTLGVAPATVLINYEVELAPSIPNGTTVLNQGHMLANGLDFPSDDPKIVGLTNPTEVYITSAADFLVEKESDDITGDPAVLVSGDTLRYTIKVKNIGTEDSINSTIRDMLPANTTYVTGSTTLNGVAVTEPIPGTLPLQAGISINTPADTTVGKMIADGSASDFTAGAFATIVFDVMINANVINGTIISNQAYVNGENLINVALPQKPSNDPNTVLPDDPTLDLVGNQPLLDAQKTVSIEGDAGTIGVLDPGETLRYTIVVTNTGAAPATGVSFIDAIPADTTYVPNSVTLNGIAVPDVVGLSPLIAGIPINSTSAASGVVVVGDTATIVFDVTVNAVASGTVISNQGYVYSNEQAVEPTDADGIESNGDQPTLISVGNAQILSIAKSVSVVGGGPVLAGGELEYRILVTNISGVPASNVIITDDLNFPVTLPVHLTYVANSALLDSAVSGVSYAGTTITADYSTSYGNLLSGQTTELVFRATIDNTLAIGTTIRNDGVVTWNAGTQTDTSTVNVIVGGTPGVAMVNGKLWHDKNYNDSYDVGEVLLENWNVDIYLNTTLLGTVTSDASGDYSINNLIPNDTGTDRYDIRFRAPGASSTTAKLGMAYSPPASGFTDDLHRIYNITLASGSVTTDMNLPIDPNGVVYDSVTRNPITGATISLLSGGTAVSSSCFDDVNQQNQITTANGYYKFDLNFSLVGCTEVAGNYVIRIVSPSGYSTTASTVIPPQTDSTTAAFDVPGCPGGVNDAVPATANICEIQNSELAPTGAATNYHLHVTLSNAVIPDDSQIFNNHLPIDPILTNAVVITKTSAFVNVTRGKLVPYTITVKNTYSLPFNNANIVDNFPPGFKYVEKSARYNDGTTEVQLEPVRNGTTLTWSNIDLPVGVTKTFRLLLIVGAAVNEGKYTNKAYVHDTLTNSRASEIANATVRVIADPDFDCSDVIGKVFDDKNLNGYQDEIEKGLAGVSLVTARGLVVTSDKHGRFHVTCAAVPNESRGSNFILKLDERSLPTGYRMTTENPRVQRMTRGKMLKFNFGTTLHRVVSMDLADGVFVPGKDEIHKQWLPRLDLLIEKLQEKPSILRLSYLADVDDDDLVDDRLQKVKDEIIEKWMLTNKYKLTIETEVFWRRGGPPDLGDID